MSRTHEGSVSDVAGTDISTILGGVTRSNIGLLLDTTESV
jgi:hypothetical protein